MTSEPLQYQIRGADAAALARSIEQGVIAGALEPGQPLPSVRNLARQLDMSPTTVASAYRDLRLRGVVVTHDRSRTTIAHRSPVATRLAPELPADTTDLATGNPDPRLLPDLSAAVHTMRVPTRLYADDPNLPALVALAREDLDADHVDAAHIAVVGGGLDGVERVLEVHTRVGDRVAVEDPCYIGTIDLVRMLGLEPVAVPVDNEGCQPDAVQQALDDGIRAMIITPRSHNPTGAALSQPRQRQLASLLAGYPHVVVIEVDAAGPVSGAPFRTLSTGRSRWATVRSLSKALGPDLRVALVAGDEETLVRVAGRQRLGTGWVSYVSQQLAADLWSHAQTHGLLDIAANDYSRRRELLLSELAAVDIDAYGASGLNVWIPVIEEVPVVQGLAARGWAVQAGEPFRVNSDPGIRVTISELDLGAVPRFVKDLGEVFGHRLGTRRG